MNYSYEEFRPKLFTDEGQRTFLAVRDKVDELLDQAGAFKSDKAWPSGDSWTMLACLDRMVELKEIVELTPEGTWGQERVFIRCSSYGA